MTRVMKGISPIGLHGGLYENHDPAPRWSLDAKEKATVRSAGYMNLVVAKLLGFERLEEVRVMGFLGPARKRHAKALVYVI
jgi:hypothetical protein